MNSWQRVRLDDVFEIARGGSPRPIDKFVTDDPDGVNWVMIGDASGGSKYIRKTRKKIRKDGVRRSRMVYPGDFILTNSMSFGRPYIMATSGCIHDGWLVLSPKTKNVDQDYFFHLLGSDAIYREFERRAAGATVKNLNIDLVKSVEVSLPPIDEQRRIAAILDQADSVKGARQRYIKRLNTLEWSIFYDLFGDPGTNPMKWPEAPLIEMSSKFSDGPFGSNLKTEHYTTSGVRVIRLQNIGVGEFIDEDRVYISERHFNSLSKHECRSGDVLVGTLGDPNLRACLLPSHIRCALNKADCVQIRVDHGVAHPRFVSSLLNIPSIEKKAQDKILGQTRSRISMGRLKTLVVPRPPLEDQLKFARVAEHIDEAKRSAQADAHKLDVLFESLLQRGFRGEL